MCYFLAALQRFGKLHRRFPSQTFHSQSAFSWLRPQTPPNFKIKFYFGRIMTIENIEISVKGKWFQVPALNIDGKHIVVKGKWLKVAVINDEEWLDTEVEDPTLCVKSLKEQSKRLRADIFSFAQKLPDTQVKYSYRTEWDSIAAVQLKSFKEWWEGVPQETRKNVRRAEKRGVVIRVRRLDESLLQDLWTLNNESPVRQGKVFTHYGKTIEQVARDQRDFLDRSDYICAYHGEELIGVVKLVYRGDVASILTFLPKASHSDKRPANAMIAKVVELCDQKGISFLVYGMFNYGKKKETPLREFKIRNGFQEVLVPHYFVPLTWWGSISMKLGLHRGLIGVLPHRVITVLVDVRARWHAWQLRRRSSTLERPNRNRQMERSIPPAGSNP
jgi:hypothetical protein